jgi:hypothetical protein
LERFKKYCSHTARRGEAVFLGFGVVSAQSQGFQTCSFAEASPKRQKSSLRTATLFLETLELFLQPRLYLFLFFAGKFVRRRKCFRREFPGCLAKKLELGAIATAPDAIEQMNPHHQAPVQWKFDIH